MRRALRSSYRANGLKNLSRVKGRGSQFDALDAYDVAPKFDEQAWEEGINDTLSWAEDQAGNAGQTTLIVDYLSPKVLDYCELTQEEYDPDEFVSVMQDELGDDYYYAINLIIDEMASMLDELRDACHQSFIENVANNILFGSNRAARYASKYAFGAGRYLPTPNRQYANMDTALRSYQQAAIRNGYKTPTTAANRSFNKEKNRQWLIQRFGTGKTQAFGGSASGLERNPGYAAYQQAAARNGKIIKP